jgi:hypothetical protein
MPRTIPPCKKTCNKEAGHQHDDPLAWCTAVQLPFFLLPVKLSCNTYLKTVKDCAALTVVSASSAAVLPFKADTGNFRNIINGYQEGTTSEVWCDQHKAVCSLVFIKHSISTGLQPQARSLVAAETLLMRRSRITSRAPPRLISWFLLASHSRFFSFSTMADGVVLPNDNPNQDDGKSPLPKRPRQDGGENGAANNTGQSGKEDTVKRDLFGAAGNRSGDGTSNLEGGSKEGAFKEGEKDEAGLRPDHLVIAQKRAALEREIAKLTKLNLERQAKKGLLLRRMSAQTSWRSWKKQQPLGGQKGTSLLLRKLHPSRFQPSSTTWSCPGCLDRTSLVSD